MRYPVSVRVDGRDVRTDVDARTLLVDFLREVDFLRGSGLAGVSRGCDQSACGSCLVRLDGLEVRACSILAVQADGREVASVGPGEGLGA